MDSSGVFQEQPGAAGKSWVNFPRWLQVLPGDGAPPEMLPRTFRSHPPYLLWGGGNLDLSSGGSWLEGGFQGRAPGPGLVDLLEIKEQGKQPVEQGPGEAVGTWTSMGPCGY